MITVIASIQVKPGQRAAFLDVFKANVPCVKAEAGCIEYCPTVDVVTGLPPQVCDDQVVTIVERWQSIEALHAHLQAPHMTTYRERVKDMVADVSLKVLQEA